MRPPAQAEAIYRKILQSAPDHADALHLLGVISTQQGNAAHAITLIEKAIGINPFEPMYHSNLGNALEEQGRLAEAAASYRQALRLNPDFAGAHNNLGNAFKAQGPLDEAIACYRQVLRINPDLADACNNLGMALGEQGRLDEAVSCYHQALRLNPDLTDALCNLGIALKEQGRLDEAVSNYLKALRLGESTDAKSGFARCVKDIHFASVDNELPRFVVRAISEAWIRPNELSMQAVRLVSLNRPVRECVDRAANAWPERLSRQALFGECGLNEVADDPLLQAMHEKYARDIRGV